MIKDQLSRNIFSGWKYSSETQTHAATYLSCQANGLDCHLGKE